MSRSLLIASSAVAGEARRTPINSLHLHTF